MEIIQQILILYIVAGVGFVLARLKVFNEQTVKTMSMLVAKVGIPALMIVKMQDAGDRSLLPAMAQTIVVSFALLIVLFYLSHLIFRHQKGLRRCIFVQMATFSNCGFMGFPVIEAALGSLGLFHSIGFNAAFTILTWTLGLRLFSAKEKGSWKQMLNPGLIASVLGVLLYALDIRLPVVINSSLNYIQQITTPLSMLVTGAYMSRITRSVALDKQMWFSCSLRLIVYPLLTFALMLLVPISVVQRNMFFITMMMPCASVTVIQALAYGTDESARMATGGVALSTILSAATIPLLLQLMPLMH